MSTVVAIAPLQRLKAKHTFSSTLVPRNKSPRTKTAPLPPILELEEPEPGDDESPFSPVFQDICNTPGERPGASIVSARAPKEPLRFPVRRMLTRSMSNKQTTPTMEFTSLCLTEDHISPRVSVARLHATRPGTNSDRLRASKVEQTIGSSSPESVIGARSRKRPRDDDELKDVKRRRVDAASPEMPRVVRRRSERQKPAQDTSARREIHVELPQLLLLPVKAAPPPTARKRSFAEVERDAHDVEADVARYSKRRGSGLRS